MRRDPHSLKPQWENAEGGLPGTKGLGPWASPPTGEAAFLWEHLAQGD